MTCQDGKTPLEVTNDEAIKLILCSTVQVTQSLTPAITTLCMRTIGQICHADFCRQIFDKNSAVFYVLPLNVFNSL